jgi:hypothetical protein
VHAAALTLCREVVLPPRRNDLPLACSSAPWRPRANSRYIEYPLVRARPPRSRSPARSTGHYASGAAPAACGIAAATILCISSALALGPVFLVTSLAGIVLGPVYPTTIALAAERVPSAAGTALGVVAAAGASAGFAVPWMIGAVGDVIGVLTAITLLGAHALGVAGAAFSLAKRDAYAAASSS